MKAVNIINGLQNYYLILELLDEDVVNESFINWDSFCGIYSAKSDNEYVLFIIEKAFDDNWFSHEEYRFIIITTNDLEKLFAPPSLKAYLIYQIAQAVISFEGDLSERMEMRMVHDYVEGRMFHLCMDKTDI